MQKMYSMQRWTTPPVHSQSETDNTNTLTVTVKDITEDPVKDATVTIGNESETTGDDGKASFTLAYGDYTASVTATGYDDAEETLAFRSNHKNFTITLTPT